MLFANDIVLVHETKEGVNANLKRWKQELKSRDIKLSWSNNEYMECNYSTNEITRGTIKLEEKEIAPSVCFKYLEYIFQSN